MATYDNPILDFAERYPIAGFFALPVAIHYGALWVSAIIRKGKTGSYLGSLFGEGHQESPLAGRGIRTEGGDADDLMFRAKASTAPTQRGTAVGDEIQPRPEGGHIRYDRNYHDSVFLPNLNYSDNDKQPIHQSYSPRITDSYVFAGIGGMNKLR